MRKPTVLIFTKATLFWSLNNKTSLFAICCGNGVTACTILSMKAELGAMKTIIVALLASCVVSLAQTNTDSSGYVTNANLLTPFILTNSAGDVITNAVLVKLMPNKFVYKTPNGGEGVMRLDSLSKDLQKKFGYNPVDAFNADVAEQTLDDAEGIEIFHAAWYDVKKKLGLYHVKLGESVYDKDPVSTMVKRQKELDDVTIEGAEKVIAAEGRLEETRIRANEVGQDPSKIEADVQAAQARTQAKVESLRRGKAVYDLKKEFAIRTAAKPMLDAAVEAAEFEAAKFPTVAPGAK
jgi:hypothetical protein